MPVRFRRGVIVVLIACTSFFLAQCVRESNTTLYENGQWLVGKRLPLVHVMGSDDYMLARAPLAGGKISLDDYFGYHEILYKHPIELSDVAFETRFAPSHSLHVIVARTETSTVYARLSKNPKHASEILYFDESTQLVKDRLHLPDFPENETWQKLRFHRDGDKMRIDVDGRFFAAFPAPPARGYFGFKSDKPDAPFEVRAIRLNANGETVAENFDSPPSLFWKTFLVAAAVLAAFTLLAVRLFPSLPPRALLALAIVSSLSYAADHWFWRHLPVNSLVSRFEHTINSELDTPTRTVYFLESLRYKIFTALTGSSTVTHEILGQRGYPPHVLYEPPWGCTDRCEDLAEKDARAFFGKPTAKTLRVVFLGTSQTYGCGARSLDDTFVARHHRFLRKKLSGRDLQTFNASYAGMTSRQVFQFYRDKIAWFNPDIIYVNINYNDVSATEEPFANNVREFIRSARPAPVVLITEPIDQDTFIVHRHATLRRVAKDENAPVLGLHEYLVESGELYDPLVWWDIIHFTNYGHRIVADWLDKNDDIERFLKSSP